MRIARVIAAAALLAPACGPGPCGETGAAPPVELRDYDIGGDFLLAGEDGEPFRLSEAQAGRPALLFFGYTVCPDVCPMTLSKLVQVYAALGERRDDVLTVFVSLDPERDTPQRIGEYLSWFDIESVGATGTEQQLEALVERYGGSYGLRPVESAMEYLVDHSSYLYLIDGRGHVRLLFSHLDDAAAIEAGVRRLLEEPQ